MKAIEISKNGGPEVLEIKDIKLSKPEEDEVTIEHRAIGLNYIDTYHRSGLYPLKLPSGIGAEGAGIIKEIAAIKNAVINRLIPKIFETSSTTLTSIKQENEIIITEIIITRSELKLFNFFTLKML